mmetsp:Transcript_37357/g.111932  ORF Transcript_37357/g.111932 Transcript_37357/m.111932 type:complete len:271 (-) Transcript_37357:449-1261(-)
MLTVVPRREEAILHRQRTPLRRFPNRVEARERSRREGGKDGSPLLPLPLPLPLGRFSVCGSGGTSFLRTAPRARSVGATSGDSRRKSAEWPRIGEPPGRPGHHPPCVGRWGHTHIGSRGGRANPLGRARGRLELSASVRDCTLVDIDLEGGLGLGSASASYSFRRHLRLRLRLRLGLRLRLHLRLRDFLALLRAAPDGLAGPRTTPGRLLFLLVLPFRLRFFSVIFFIPLLGRDGTFAFGSTGLLGFHRIVPVSFCDEVSSSLAIVTGRR